jgi:hypothetical protein
VPGNTTKRCHQRPRRDAFVATWFLLTSTAVKLRVLAVFPFACALAVLLVAAALPDDQRWNVIYDMTRTAKLVALFGCLVAGLSFEPGEHMRRGWLQTAVCYGLLVLRDGVIHGDLLLDHHLPLSRWIDVAMVVLANVVGVMGCWTMASAWRVSGVELPGKRSWRRAAQAATVVMAVAITLPSLAIEAPRLLDGGWVPITSVVGSLADAFSLALIAPVVMTAIGLRGTRIAWPWAMLAVSMFGWLLYDATFSVSQLVGLDGRPLLAFGDASRVLAATGAGAAGVMQRLIATAWVPELAPHRR